MTAQHPARHNSISGLDFSDGVIVESSSIMRSRTVYERFLKRSFDVVVAGGVLLLASPILLATWLGLRLTLGSNVILTQDRVGRGGTPFQMLKFRTMRHDRRAGGLRFEGQEEFYDLHADPYEYDDLLRGELSTEQRTAYEALQAEILLLRRSK